MRFYVTGWRMLIHFQKKCMFRQILYNMKKILFSSMLIFDQYSVNWAMRKLKSDTQLEHKHVYTPCVGQCCKVNSYKQDGGANFWGYTPHISCIHYSLKPKICWSAGWLLASENIRCSVELVRKRFLYCCCPPMIDHRKSSSEVHLNRRFQYSDFLAAVLLVKWGKIFPLQARCGPEGG